MEDIRTNSEDNPNENSVNILRNSEEIEHKTMVAIEEYAPEIRDIYKGIKDIKGENVPPEEKDNKEDVIKNISKKRKTKNRKLSKVSEGSSKTVPVIPCKASLDEPSCKAVETTLNEENLPKDNSLLNNGPRKNEKISKKVKMSEEYIHQNVPGTIRRSPRIMEKQFKADVLTQKKKSALHKVMKNSEAIRKRKHKSRKSISLQTCVNEAPTSFEHFNFKDGRSVFGFRWTGHKRIIYFPLEELTEPMRILLKPVLQSTLVNVNNPLYFKSVDNTSNNSMEVMHPVSMENSASVSNVDCFGFDKTMRTILQYREVQSQMQSKYLISNGEATTSDVDVKFNIE